MNNLPVTPAASTPINPNENFEKLRTAITEAQTQGDTKTIVSLLKQLGQAYMEVGDAPQALTEFNEAIKLVFNSEDDKEIFAQLLGFRGLALKLIGNYSLAVQSFRKSNALALEIKHSALSCDSLIHLAALHSEMGKVDDAIAVLNEALGIASEYKDKVRIMRVNGLLGDNFLKRAEPAKASEHFQLAYETAQNIGNKAAGCSFITKLGNVLLLEGKTERAIDKYEYALKLASALADRNAEINILGGLFRAHALAVNIDPTFTYGEQVIHLAAEISHYEAEIANIQALASFSIEQGMAEKALPYLERGIQIAKKQVNMGWEMELLSLYSKAYYVQGKYTEALNSLDEALTLATNLQDEFFMATTLGRMSAIYAEINDLENSINSAERALELSLVLEDVELCAQQQVILAFNYRDLDQIDEAIQYCSAALISYKNIGNQAMIEQVQTLLAELNTLSK